MEQIDHTLGNWMFPLRVVETDEGGAFDIWTKEDTRPGSLNNFVITGGIQHKPDAERICSALNSQEYALCS